MQTTFTNLLAHGTWHVDPSTATAAFSVSNFMLNRVTGTIAVRSGRLVVDPEGRPRAVEAVLDSGSIDSGNAKRDADLRSHRFLDVERHPTIRYVADEVTSEQTGWRVDGHLTVSDYTTPLALEVEAAEVGSETRNRLNVTAHGVLDRATVGIRAPAFVIGRQVALSLTATLHLVATRP